MATAVSVPEGPVLLDVRGAAAFIGVSVAIIRRWTREGLPHVCAGRGGRKLFTRPDLCRWVERCKEERHE